MEAPFTCQVCGHQWFPIYTNVPVHCPTCNNTKWFIPRKYEKRIAKYKALALKMNDHKHKYLPNSICHRCEYVQHVEKLEEIKETRCGCCRGYNTLEQIGMN